MIINLIPVFPSPSTGEGRAEGSGKGDVSYLRITIVDLPWSSN